MNQALDACDNGVEVYALSENEGKGEGKKQEGRGGREREERGGGETDINMSNMHKKCLYEYDGITIMEF